VPPIASGEQTTRERRWAVALLGLRVLALVVVVAGVPSFPSAAANRFHEIASMPGVPYRDFAIEYPPGELLLVEVIGAASPGVARVLLALLAAAADLAAAAALRAGWGARAMVRYLALGTPLLFFLYRRLDLVAVSLAVWGIVLSRREQRSGGVALGAALLTRLWPVVLLPLVAIERRTRPIRALIVTVVVGVAGWLAVGGPGALREVATFRGARGWEVESTVGVVVWTLTGERRFEQGAFRAGVVPGWVRLILLAALIGGLAALWWRARAYPGDLAGAPALVAVAILLVLSPVLSPGYVMWLLPWGALAAMQERRWLWLAAAPLVITGGIMAAWYLDISEGHPGWSQVALMLRNLAILLIPVVWFAGSVRPVVVRSRRGISSGRVRTGP